MKVNTYPILPQHQEVERFRFLYHSVHAKNQEEELIQKINALREERLKREAENQEIDQLMERVEKGLEQTEQLVKKIRQNEEEGLKRRESMLQDIQIAQQQVEENTICIDRIEKQAQDRIQEVDQIPHIQEEMDQILTSLEQDTQQEQQEVPIVCPSSHTWSIFTFATSFFDQHKTRYESIATLIRTQSFFWMTTTKLIENPRGWITTHTWALVADTSTHPVTWVAVGIVCYVFPLARLAVGGVAFYTLTHYASLKSRQLEDEIE